MKLSKIYLFLIFILIVIRVGYHIANPDIYSDNIAQIATAQNFMEGHGFSFKYINAELETYYKTDIQYPPLYSLLLALLTFVTANPMLSSFIIQLVVLLLITIIWKKIFNILRPFISEKAYIYFISLLLMSTSIFNIINTILFVALLLLSISLYFIISYLLTDNFNNLQLYLFSFLAALSFWTHYSNFLVAFYPALVLFVIFYLNKNKIYLYSAFISFIISLIVTSSLLFYNYLTTGLINYLENPFVWETGLFLKHLLLIDPFFLNAFIKSSYIYAYLFSNNQPLFLTLLFQIISFTIFLLILFLYLRLKKNGSVNFEKVSLILLPFFAIIALIILFLLYPTLRYHEIALPSWTHIGEPRYLSFVYISIITIVIMLVFINVDNISRKFIKVVKAVLICLIFTNLIIVVSATVSDLDQYNYKMDTYNQGHQDLINSIKQEFSKGNLPVFIDSDLIVDSFRMSQLVKAAAIQANEVKKIKQFPSNIVFFFTLPDENNYREIDYQLIKWGNQFNMEKIGKVRTVIPLYKVKS